MLWVRLRGPRHIYAQEHKLYYYYSYFGGNKNLNLSELLKICQKLQYSSTKQIKNKHSALSLYPSDAWLE